MTGLLGDLGDLSVHYLLMGGYNVKFGGRLTNELAKGLIGLDLARYEALHKTLQVRFRLRR